MPRRARSSGLSLQPGEDMATRGREPATFLTESLCAETEPPRRHRCRFHRCRRFYLTLSNGKELRETGR